jgi:preprotein translocase subunit SecG
MLLYTLAMVILIVTALVLVVAILMQAGKGGGLAANFGGAGSSSDSFLGSRQASNILTKSSWYAGAIFLALSYLMSLAAARPDVGGSVLDPIIQSAPAPAPGAPTLPTPGAAGGEILTLPPGTQKTDTGAAAGGTGKSGGKLPE